MPECERKFDRDLFWAHFSEMENLIYDPDTQRFVPWAPPQGAPTGAQPEIKETEP